jgi:hypothetical protein
MQPATWIVVAFVAAAVVMGLAVFCSPATRQGFTRFVADLRVGPRPDQDSPKKGLIAATREDFAAAADPSKDGGVDDLFAFGEAPEHAYVDPTIVTDPLVRATRSLRARVRS